MTYQYRNKTFPLGNPLANALVIVIGTLAIAASIVLGLMAFVVLGSLLLVMGAAIGIRVWWLNRRLRKQYGQGRRAERPPGDRIRVIEGEYREVSRRDRRE